MILYNFKLFQDPASAYDKQVLSETLKNNFTKDNTNDRKVILNFDRNIDEDSRNDIKCQVRTILGTYMIPFLDVPTEEIQLKRNNLFDLIDIQENVIDMPAEIQSKKEPEIV